MFLYFSTLHFFPFWEEIGVDILQLPSFILCPDIVLKETVPLTISESQIADLVRLEA